MNPDRSFKAYAAQSPTIQTMLSNRRLWRANLVALLVQLALFQTAVVTIALKGI